MAVLNRPAPPRPRAALQTCALVIDRIAYGSAHHRDITHFDKLLILQAPVPYVRYNRLLR